MSRRGCVNLTAAVRSAIPCWSQYPPIQLDNSLVRGVDGFDTDDVQVEMNDLRYAVVGPGRRHVVLGKLDTDLPITVIRYL